MTVTVHRKVKIHKTSKRAAMNRCASEIADMMKGLTLEQMRSVLRYTRLLQSTHSTKAVQ